MSEGKNRIEKLIAASQVIEISDTDDAFHGHMTRDFRKLATTSSKRKTRNDGVERTSSDRYEPNLDIIDLTDDLSDDAKPLFCPNHAVPEQMKDSKLRSASSFQSKRLKTISAVRHNELTRPQRMCGNQSDLTGMMSHNRNVAQDILRDEEPDVDISILSSTKNTRLNTDANPRRPDQSLTNRNTNITRPAQISHIGTSRQRKAKTARGYVGYRYSRGQTNPPPVRSTIDTYMVPVQNAQLHPDLEAYEISHREVRANTVLYREFQEQLDYNIALHINMHEQFSYNILFTPLGNSHSGSNHRSVLNRLAEMNRDFNSSDYESLLNLDSPDRSKYGALSKTEVQNFPTKMKEGSSGDDCAICLGEINPSCKLLSLPCTHEFHAACMRKWIARNPTCPICKTHV